MADDSSNALGGFLSGSGSSPSGGLLGMDPSLLLHIGLGLLSAGGKNLAGQGNVGTALQQSLGNYYAGKEAQQKIQEGNLGMMKAKTMLNIVGGLMGDPGQPAPQPTQPMAPPSPTAGASPFQQGPPTPGATAAPSWLTPPSQADLSQTPIGGMRPNLLRAYDLMMNKDPLASSKEIENAQLEQNQRKYAPAISKLDTVIKSDSPSREVNADPELSSAWQVLAKQHGYDPKADLNDQNLRTAFTFARNGLASAIGQPTIAPTVQMKQTQGPLGSVLQTNPIDNKTEEIVKPEPLKDVIVNGQPTNVRASQAEGKQPYIPAQFQAGQMTDPAKEFAYQWFLQHGSLPANFARSPLMQSSMMSYIADRAKQEGNTAASITANTQQVKASQGVVKEFESGQTSKTLNGLNTAISHMDQMDQAATALGNGNMQALNKMGNFFSTQLGSNKVNDFNVVKNFAAGEVAKAVLPGGGGEHEREEIADAIKNSNSPQQLHSAIQMWKNLLAGKTEALRNQWDVGTGGNQGDFNKFLLPATKKALGIADAGGVSHPSQKGQSTKIGGFTVTRVN